MESMSAGLAVAPTNKSLAQSNKSQDVGKATNEAFGPYSLSSWFRAGRAESALANLPRPSTRLGPFSVHSRDEQIFGADEQILGPGSERLRGVIRRLDPEALAYFLDQGTRGGGTPAHGC